jgi:hypothetical protein
MRHSLRTTLLAAAALLTLIGAIGYAFVVLPDLHGDLVEIGVRPTVLGGTVLHLRFAAVAMFGFALMVCAAALQSARGLAFARLPLAIVAAIYTIFGVMAFSRSYSPHHLGTLAVGVLLAAALSIPRPRDGDADARA